jgi:hypothetical protein
MLHWLISDDDKVAGTTRSVQPDQDSSHRKDAKNAKPLKDFLIKTVIPAFAGKTVLNVLFGKLLCVVAVKTRVTHQICM